MHVQEETERWCDDIGVAERRQYDAQSEITQRVRRAQDEMAQRRTWRQQAKAQGNLVTPSTRVTLAL